MSQLKILYIDDDENDAFFLEHAVRSCGMNAEVVWAPSVARAVESLESAPSEMLPDFIICDLKMPTQDGFDFLRWIRDSRFSVLPVIILSSSNLPKDVTLSYELGANSFLTKPVQRQDLIELAQSVLHYWRTCKVPTRDGLQVV